MIQHIIRNQTDVGLIVSEPQNFIQALTDTTSDTIYWPYPYLSSLSPEITTTKMWFWLWSTDHDSGDGGVYWGESDDLAGNGFIERGLIIDGFQAETPIYRRYPSNPRPIHIYYHTDSEPVNLGAQRTRLITTTGGLLHSATYVDEGHPLGFEAGDQHNGYLNFDDIGGDLIGTHYKTGDIPVMQYSTISADGLSSTRGVTFTDTSYCESGYYNLTSFGIYFEKYGKYWWVGIKTVLITGGSPDLSFRAVVLYEANQDRTFKRKIGNLFNFSNYVYSAYKIHNEVLWLYSGTRRISSPNYTAQCVYRTFDLTQLAQL